MVRHPPHIQMSINPLNHVFFKHVFVMSNHEKHRCILCVCSTSNNQWQSHSACRIFSGLQPTKLAVQQPKWFRRHGSTWSMDARAISSLPTVRIPVASVILIPMECLQICVANGCGCRGSLWKQTCSWNFGRGGLVLCVHAGKRKI